MNDTEEALLLFEIKTFSFRILPSHFAEVLRSGVPAGPFSSCVHNMAGHPVDRDALVDDLAGDYRELATLPAAALRSPLSCHILSETPFLLGRR
ncbi:MAG: hypothetical protein WBQ79_19750 [Acidobacteriaceae bacterium]